MKKTVSVLLLIVMIASMLCVPVFAANGEQNPVSNGDATVARALRTIYINGIDYDFYDTTYVGYNYVTTGRYVEIVQRAMNRLNVLYPAANCYAGAVDGIFGQNTWTAVFNFQAWCGLSADGIVGTNTWNMMIIYCY